MKKVMSLNDHAVKNCSKAIELNPNYLKALLRRAEIYEETDKLGKYGCMRSVTLSIYTMITSISTQKSAWRVGDSIYFL